jgi:hypothetical protein
VIALVALIDIAVKPYAQGNKPVVAAGLGCAVAVAVSGWWWGRQGPGKVVDQQASVRQVASHVQLVARRVRGEGRARNLYIGTDLSYRFRYTDFGFRPSSRTPGKVVDQRVLRVCSAR